MKKKAFTLVELLVVISIIALLVSILMPALTSARQKATAAVCMGNQKALIMAWVMYHGENDSRLVGGTVSGPGTNYWGWPGTEFAWAQPPMKVNADDVFMTWANETNVTLEDRKAGIRKGLLYEFIETVDVYHCPGDFNIKRNPDIITNEPGNILFSDCGIINR